MTDATDLIIQEPDATSLLQVIQRAARDPNIDIEKMERLFELYGRIQGRGAEQAYNTAMSACQAELRPVAADAENPQTRSRYASYAALDRMVRPIYTKHGFSLSFDTGEAPAPENVRVICKVAHSGGHSTAPHIDMPADGKGAKGGDVMTKTHAAGAAMSYGQRYLLKLIFNLAVGEDRDGNADTGEVISDEQAATLTALIEETKSDLGAFLRFFKAKELADLRAAKFKDAISMLEKKKGQKA